MPKYSVRKYTLGLVQTNCFVVSSKSKQCIVFDPGEQGAALINDLHKNGLKPIAIFLTHAHFDHIGAVDMLRDAFDIPVYIHEAEVSWLADPIKNGSGKYKELQNVIVNPPKGEHIIRQEQTYHIGDFEFDAVFTPGHSPGSVTFKFKEDGFAIVGDTLFERSIGRTDLIGGSMDVLLKSIREKILTLPADTIIYPGHGEHTTPADELQNNPFINGF